MPNIIANIFIGDFGFLFFLRKKNVQSDPKPELFFTEA